MRRKRRILGLSLVAIAIVIAAMTIMAYQASQHVPSFYTAALAGDETEQAAASAELGTRVTTLYNDARRSGDWFALFSAAQINGWLAVDLIEKHGDLIDDNVQDPRVGITKDNMQFAVRVEQGGIAIVYSFTIDVYLAKPNVIAFRIRQAKAGMLPLPMSEVLSEVTETAEEMNVALRWSRVEGDPVALVTIAPQADEENNELWLEKLELRDGELYLAGRTVTAEENVERPDDGAALPGQSVLAFQLRDHIKRQP